MVVTAMIQSSNNNTQTMRGMRSFFPNPPKKETAQFTKFTGVLKLLVRHSGAVLLY